MPIIAKSCKNLINLYFMLCTNVLYIPFFRISVKFYWSFKVVTVLDRYKPKLTLIICISLFTCNPAGHALQKHITKSFTCSWSLAGSPCSTWVEILYFTMMKVIQVWLPLPVIYSIKICCLVVLEMKYADRWIDMTSIIYIHFLQRMHDNCLAMRIQK